jgi:phospholipase C
MCAEGPATWTALNPDTGEEYPHTNTQLYGILSEANRFKLGAEISAPYNAPPPGRVPTMDGFVTDYISTLTAELGRQPTYEEYAQVMTGFTPEQIPVLSGLARGFGVFDHWFCEVPSQTFTNRSFWTAATASGFVVNEPVTNWLTHNTAETIFNRLEQHGKTWKVYVAEPDRFSATGVIHYPRLKDRFATHFVPFAQFEGDAASGNLPNLAYIEPCLTLGHGDYHPAVSRALGHGVVIPGVEPPSSILGGEAFLARIYNAYKQMQSPAGSNVWNTALLIGWDEPGGTYDHVPPGPVPPPDLADPRPVPDYIQDALGLGQTLSTLGKAAFNGIRAYAEQHNIQIDGLPADPQAQIPPEQALHIIHNFLAIQFPQLHPAISGPGAPKTA